MLNTLENAWLAYSERSTERDREERKNTSGNRIKSRAIDRNIKWGFTRGHK